jgi:hypothetical protein
MPLGFRRELSQVRNRQLQLARDKAVLEDLELEIVHQLTTAIQDLDMNYAVSQSRLDQIRATVLEVNAIQEAWTAGTATLDRLLDAQRRRSIAEREFYSSLANYNLAVMQVHYRKGSLLDYTGIMLAEGPWPAKAYYDAHSLARRRDASYYLDYGHSRPKVISRGPVQQKTIPSPTGSLESVVAPEPDPMIGEPNQMIEPIPAPEPAGEPTEPPTPALETPTPALEAPTADSPRPATPSAGPVLSAPRLSSTGPRPTQAIHRAGYVADSFEWRGQVSQKPNRTGPEQGNPQPRTPERVAPSTAAGPSATKPVKRVIHLKWR